jgi:uncharacterized membrane protein
MSTNIGIRETGIFILAIAVVLFILMSSITSDLNATLHSECACGPGVCPMEGNLPIQSYAGYSITIILGGFGLYLFAKSRRLARLSSESTERFRKTIDSLRGEEKRIVESISNSDGVVFQSDLVDKLDISKVRVSRILDRLEHKGLIERRRRGMSNIVLLKES